MMNKVKVIAQKIEPVALALGTIGAIMVFADIYEALWSVNKISVFATGMMFAYGIIEWWEDFFERKRVKKLLDNF